VWMHAGRVVAEAGVSLGERSAATGGVQGLSDAHERRSARVARALDHRVAISIERRVGQMDVTVDELHHACTNRRTRRRFAQHFR